MDQDSVEHLSRLIDNVAHSSKNRKKYIEREKERNKIKTQLTRPIVSKQTPYDDMEDYLVGLKSDAMLDVSRNRKRTKDLHRKALKELLSQCQFAGEEYQQIYKNNSVSIRPLIRFFRHMVPRRSGYKEQVNFVTKSKLQLHIPYTVIYGLDSCPIMYYTDKDGFVCRVDNPSSRRITRALIAPPNEDISEDKKEDDKSDDKREETKKYMDEFSIVMKREFPGDVITNMATPMTRKQVKTLLEQPISAVTVFQSYVPCKGGKASLARIAWCADRPSYGFMLSNRKSRNPEDEKNLVKQLMVDTKDLPNLLVFKMSGKSVNELSFLTHRLAKYVEQRSRQPMRIREFVCDFIRDENSQWWFTQAKAIVLETPSKILRRRPLSAKKFRENRSNYVRMKECKMCLNLFEPQELMYHMSLKMIFATETHLKRRAIKLPWFDRPEYNSISDTSLWYTFHKVCKGCFDMYLQEQKLAKVETEFARAIGIPVNDKIHERASILSTLGDRLRSASTFRDRKRTSDVVMRLRERGLRMYRFILYLNELRKLPPSLMGGLTLRVTVFNSEVLVPLQPSTEAHLEVLPVGKLRVFYFFVTDDEVFRKWIRKVDQLHVEAYDGDDLLGKATLQLSQFSSGLIDKLDYMTFFSGSEMGLCALRVTLGFVKMKDMDLSNVHLEEYDEHIYIPEEDFFTADPLPDEWLEVIPRLTSDLPLDQVHKAVDRIGTAGRVRRPHSATYPRRPTSALSTMTARSYMSTPGGYHRRQRPSSAMDLTSPPRMEGGVTAGSSASPSGGLTSRTLQIRTSSARKTRPEAPQLSYQSRPTARRRPQSASAAHARSYSRTLSTGGTPHSARTSDRVSSARRSPSFSRHGSSSRLGRGTPTGQKSQATTPERGVGIFAQEPTHKAPYGPEDHLFRFNVRLGTVANLHSPVDKSWNLSITLFREVKLEYETFQLLPGPDLDFGTGSEEIFLSTTSKLLEYYFSREKYVIVVLRPKWEPDNLLVARVDMTKLEVSASSHSKLRRGACKFDLSTLQIGRMFMLEKKTEAEFEDMMRNLEFLDDDDLSIEDGMDDEFDMGHQEKEESDSTDDAEAGKSGMPQVQLNITCTRLGMTQHELSSRAIPEKDVTIVSHLEEFGVRVIQHPKLSAHSK